MNSAGATATFVKSVGEARPPGFVKCSATGNLELVKMIFVEEAELRMHP